jgi:hypothetical protein
VKNHLNRAHHVNSVTRRQSCQSGWAELRLRARFRGADCGLLARPAFVNSFTIVKR